MNKRIGWIFAAGLIVLVILILSGGDGPAPVQQGRTDLTVEMVQQQLLRVKAQLTASQQSNRRLIVGAALLVFFVNTAGLAGLGWYFKRLALGGGFARAAADDDTKNGEKSDTGSENS